MTISLNTSAWIALRASQKSRKTVWFGGGLMSSHAPQMPEQHLRSHAAHVHLSFLAVNLLSNAQHSSAGCPGTHVTLASTIRACANFFVARKP